MLGQPCPDVGKVQSEKRGRGRTDRQIGDRQTDRHRRYLDRQETDRQTDRQWIDRQERSRQTGDRQTDRKETKTTGILDS